MWNWKVNVESSKSQLNILQTLCLHRPFFWQFYNLLVKPIIAFPSHMSEKCSTKLKILV